MNKNNTIIGFFLWGYLAVLIYWMFIGFYRTTHDQMMYNLTPFFTIKKYILYYSYFDYSTWIINMAGNVGVFIPFGVLLPLYNEKLENFLRFLAIFIIGISCLEALQLITRKGSFDVDDIILNTAGAIIGFIIILIIKREKIKLN